MLFVLNKIIKKKEFSYKYFASVDVRGKKIQPKPFFLFPPVLELFGKLCQFMQRFGFHFQRE